MSLRGDAGHSTEYRISRVSAEGGVWVRAYRTWSCGGWTVRYDVLAASATWLGCDQQYADRVLREMCNLSPEKARVRRLRANQLMREKIAGCPRRGRLP